MAENAKDSMIEIMPYSWEIWGQLKLETKISLHATTEK